MTRHLTLVKACSLALALLCAPADAANGAREMMAEAMTRMMEAMGMFGSGSGGMGMGMNPMSAWGLGPGGFGAPGGIPGGMPWNAMQQFSGAGMPGFGQGFPWSGTGLQGIWEGRNGELLIVQGNRFRLYPGNAGYLDGYMQLSGDRLALYNPQDAQAQPFEYAESDGRLVLRDGAGQIYLYRRLQLDRDAAAPAGMPSPR